MGEIFTKHFFFLPLAQLSKWAKKAAKKAGHVGVVVLREEDYLPGILAVRLQFPEDISSGQKAHW